MQKLTNNFDPEHYGFLFHYYRGEVYRETNWRNRLDITTNWSIVVTAGILTFAFGNENISHAVIIVNYLVVLFFLNIESRRFRYYSVLRERTKLLEKDILGPLFSNKDRYEITDKSLNSLAELLESPKIKMSRLESISWRLRRNYIFIIPLLFLVWFFKVANNPVKAVSVGELMQNAGVIFIPGWVVFGSMFLSVVLLIWVALYIPKKYGHDDLP